MESQNEFPPYRNPHFPRIGEGQESSPPTQVHSVANYIGEPHIFFPKFFPLYIKKEINFQPPGKIKGRIHLFPGLRTFSVKTRSVCRLIHFTPSSTSHLSREIWNCTLVSSSTSGWACLCLIISHLMRVGVERERHSVLSSCLLHQP